MSGTESDGTLDEVVDRLVSAWMRVQGPMTAAWNRKLVREALEAGVLVVSAERARERVREMGRRLRGQARGGAGLRESQEVIQEGVSGSDTLRESIEKRYTGEGVSHRDTPEDAR